MELIKEQSEDIHVDRLMDEDGHNVIRFPSPDV